MTLITPFPGKGDGDAVLDVAKRQLTSVLNELDRLKAQLEAGDDTASKETPRALRELRGAVNSALNERDRLEALSREQNGIVNGYGLDFDAARVEIGGLLDRIRASRSAGEVSE